MAKPQKKTLRRAIQSRVEMEQLERRRVALIRDVPDYRQLKVETIQHLGTERFGLSAMLAFARHTYTNYDTLCNRAARVALRNSMPQHLLQSIVDDYRREANALIKEVIGWTGE